MTQSQRIKYCKEYQNHPLKQEYLEKKSKITGTAPVERLNSIVTILIYVYGIIFAIGFLGLFFFDYIFYYGFDESHGIDDFWLSQIIMLTAFVLGLINIVLSFVLVIFKDDFINLHEKKYSNELKKLKDYYWDKGLVEVEESELFKHECCEYDDYKEKFVCCATKQSLSYNDIRFCKQPGNCRYCRLFVTAYLGPDGPKYWSYEFKK